MTASTAVGQGTHTTTRRSTAPVPHHGQRPRGHERPAGCLTIGCAHTDTDDATPGDAALSSLHFGRIPTFSVARADDAQESPHPASTPPPHIIQRKLAVGREDDELEHEADRAAEQVMRIPETGAGMPRISRRCSAHDEQAEPWAKRTDGHLAGHEAPTLVDDVLGSPGKPLEATTRAFFEPRFGMSFSDVRVHTDPAAALSAQRIGALGYTLGRHIAFAGGHYAPATGDGRRLLAHELAHVAQQRGSSDRQVRREGDPNQMPKVLPCAPAISSAPTPVATFLFDNLGTTLTSAQQVQIAEFVNNWRSTGAGATVRIDGFASKPGSESLNWQLSCERAMAVKAALMKPTPLAGDGIPERAIELFMHGETTEFGKEAQNRRVSLSLEAAPTPPQPPQPSPPSPTPPPTCDPAVKDITKLPAVMDAKGWPHGAALMREWFSLPAGVAPSFADTDSTTVTMDWVLSFKRAKEAYDAIFADKTYVNEAARKEIAKLLSRLGVDKGGVFGFARPVTSLDPDFDINFTTAGSTFDSFDDLTATLGRFTLRMVVGGRVDPDSSTGRFRVTLTDVGVHVRDSFDFTGWQPLGCWNVCTNEVGRVSCGGGVYVYNSDFEAWRTANKRGGDLKVLSDVKATHLTTPETFLLP